MYLCTDEKDVRNCRPPTLMKVDCKILTLLFLKRLVDTLDKVYYVGVHQTAYLRGRLIDDNMRTVQYLVLLGPSFLQQEKSM